MIHNIVSQTKTDVAVFYYCSKVTSFCPPWDGKIWIYSFSQAHSGNNGKNYIFLEVSLINSSYINHTMSSTNWLTFSTNSGEPTNEKRSLVRK